MSEQDRIREHMAREGAILVRPVFLDAAGSVELPSTDSPVTGLMLDDRAIGFAEVFGDRPHVHSYRKIRRSGDEWIVDVNDGLQLVLSPVWTKEQQDSIQDWMSQDNSERRARSAENLRLHFADVAANPSKPKPLGALRKYRAMWYSRLVKGGLQTAGILVEGGGKIGFTPVPGQASLASLFETALASQPPEQVFSYFSEAGNGVTEDWSAPFTIEAHTIEEAAAKALARRG